MRGGQGGRPSARGRRVIHRRSRRARTVAGSAPRARTTRAPSTRVAATSTVSAPPDTSASAARACSRSSGPAGEQTTVAFTAAAPRPQAAACSGPPPSTRSAFDDQRPSVAEHLEALAATPPSEPVAGRRPSQADHLPAEERGVAFQLDRGGQLHLGPLEHDGVLGQPLQPCPGRHSQMLPLPGQASVAAPVHLRGRRRGQQRMGAGRHLDRHLELVTGHQPAGRMQQVDVADAGSFGMKRPLHLQRPAVPPLHQRRASAPGGEAQGQLAVPPRRGRRRGAVGIGGGIHVLRGTLAKHRRATEAETALAAERAPFVRVVSFAYLTCRLTCPATCRRWPASAGATSPRGPAPRA